jgi:hypothetical protein
VTSHRRIGQPNRFSRDQIGPAGVVKILPEYELITLMLMGHPVRPRKIALTVHLDCAEIGERGN